MIEKYFDFFSKLFDCLISFEAKKWFDSKKKLEKENSKVDENWLEKLNNSVVEKKLVGEIPFDGKNSCELEISFDMVNLDDTEISFDKVNSDDKEICIE